jgi:hypothetical protein
LVKSKNGNIDKKNVDDKTIKEKNIGHPGAGRETEIIVDRKIDDTKTRQFPQDQVKERIQARNQNDIEQTVEDDGEIAISFRIKKQSPYRPLLLILGIVLLSFIALFVYQMIRSHRNTMMLKKATELETRQDSNAEFLESLEERKTMVEPEDQTQDFAFSDDIFQGEAPLRAEAEGVLFTKERDAELVAIGDAMNIRARLLFGIKTTQKGDILTETCNGNFNGFRISSLKVRLAGKIIQDEISISTPSRGLIKITGKTLDSVTRTRYDQVLKDLEAAGLKVYKRLLPEKNAVQIQLRMTGVSTFRSGDASLFTGIGVGNIALDAKISDMKSLLPPRYRMIKRRIMMENEFVIIYKIEDQNRTPLFYVYERDAKIWGLQIVNNSFRTTRGLGIGSSLGAMRIYYTNLNIRSLPGKVTYLWIDQKDFKEIKFILADDKRINFEDSIFPFDIKVNSILIGKSPYLN